MRQGDTILKLKKLFATLLCLTVLALPLTIVTQALTVGATAGAFVVGVLRALLPEIAMDIALDQAGKTLSAIPNAKRYNKLIHTAEGRVEWYAWEVAQKNAADTYYYLEPDWQRAEAQCGKRLVSGWLSFNAAYKKFYGNAPLNAPKNRVTAAKNYADLYNMVLLAKRDITLMNKYWADYQNAQARFNSGRETYLVNGMAVDKVSYANFVNNFKWPAAPNLSPGWVKPKTGTSFGKSSKDKTLASEIAKVQKKLEAKLTAAKMVAEKLKK
jgi:hypothetical protein